MKAKHEFSSEEQYLEYLRAYYAGVALSGILSIPTSFKDNSKAVVITSVSYADELIKRLNLKTESV